MSTLLDDLEERGLLEDTLVITLAEFGRTPRSTRAWAATTSPRAWSATLSGCGIKGGSVYGKTDDDGKTVVDGEVRRRRAVRHDLSGAGHRPNRRTTTSARGPSR